ncbi:MAG: cation transporter [Desulfobacterales bacterium]|nr:cation transporter [Desulfobacterales bacterium]
MRKVGQEINSPSLIANAEHIRVDMFGNAAVLVGLLSSFIDVDLDRIIAFIIVAIIAWAGGKILIDGIRVLLDASLDYKTLSSAEKLILAESQVIDVQNLMDRNSGRYKFIEANIILKTHDLEKAYHIAHRIEENIRKQIKNVDRVLIYFEPTQKENLIYALPLKDVKKQLISDHFGEAPFFSLVTVKIKNRTAIEQKIIENPFTHVKSGKGILVAEFLNKHSIDFIITRKTFDGKGPFYVFANSAVENLITEEESQKTYS